MSEDHVTTGPWIGHPALRPVHEGKADTYRHRDLWRNAALAAPLVLVTVVATFGQIGWFAEQIARHGALPVPVGLAALVCALTVETISLFLAAEAHARLMAGDPAGPVRTMSYIVAAFVGLINWSHWRPGVIALVFGAMSALAPVLWAIRSRSLRRAELRLVGALDEPSLKLGWRRWVLYPRRAWQIYRVAVWDGVTDPAKALAFDAPAPAEPVKPKPLPRIVVKPHTARSPEADKVVEVRALLTKDPNLTARRLAELRPQYGSKSTCATLIGKAKDATR